MAYPPEVERWRPLVAKYFPASLVDKALYVINGESGGDPGSVGDGGSAVGLFQIHHGGSIAGRPDADALRDPETNIRYAAQQLGAANNRWSDWGEGVLHQGKKFGALGNNPYPGTGGSNVPDSDWLNNYSTTYARWATLDDKFQAAQALGKQVRFDPDLGLIAGEMTDELGNVRAEGRVLMTPQEYQEYFTLDRQLGDMEDEYEQGGGDVDDAIRRATFAHDADPRTIDAKNAANRYARELDVRTKALDVADKRMQEDRLANDSAEKSFNNFVSTASWGQTFKAPSMMLQSPDQLFNDAVSQIKKGLPEVPDIPYYDSAGVAATRRPPLSSLRRPGAASSSALPNVGPPKISPGTPDSIGGSTYEGGMGPVFGQRRIPPMNLPTVPTPPPSLPPGSFGFPSASTASSPIDIPPGSLGFDREQPRMRGSVLAR